jgi:hypothetical protein
VRRSDALSPIGHGSAPKYLDPRQPTLALLAISCSRLSEAFDFARRCSRWSSTLLLAPLSAVSWRDPEWAGAESGTYQGIPDGPRP